MSDNIISNMWQRMKMIHSGKVEILRYLSHGNDISHKIDTQNRGLIMSLAKLVNILREDFERN